MDRITPRTLSGFKDRLPNEAIKKREILNRLSEVFESFGFAPIETPHLEYADVLLKRGSKEIQKELYRFKDHGGRDVALRFDLTVPLARFATQHRHSIRLPFKRYAIGSVFRGERAQAGRYREFTQCDFDFLGSDSLVADAEIIAVLEAGFEALGIEEFKISINNRKLMNGLLNSLGYLDLSEEILRIVDKLDKIGKERVGEELKSAGVKDPIPIVELIGLKGSREGFFEQLEMLSSDPMTQEGVRELKELVAILEAMGIRRDRVEIDLSIARGLSYYTGIVYESKIEWCKEIGSVASGGRYDNLTSSFSDEKISGVGASFGVDRLLVAIKRAGLLKERQTPATILGVALDKNSLLYILQALNKMRKNGIKCEVYPDSAKLKKQLDFANAKGYKYVLIAGDSEVVNRKFVLKNMQNGEQKSLNLDDVIFTLKADV